MVLSTLKAGDGSLVHEVVPAADGEAGNVHAVEVQRAILIAPVVIVSGVPEPFFEESIIVHGIPTDLCQ